VPPPVTPPKTDAAIGADITAATMPVAIPARTTYATLTSRRTMRKASRPTPAATTSRRPIQPKTRRIRSSDAGEIESPFVAHVTNGEPSAMSARSAIERTAGTTSPAPELRGRGRKTPAMEKLPASRPTTMAVALKAAAIGLWNGGGTR